MKKLSIWGSLLALLLMIVIAVPAHAETKTSIQPYSDWWELPSGEIVDVTGFWRATTSYFWDASGGRHNLLSMNLLNCTGIGRGTLNEYRVFGSEVVSFYFAPESIPQARTQVIKLNFIGKGDALNQSVSLIMHVTVNPDGETVVRFLKEF